MSGLLVLSFFLACGARPPVSPVLDDAGSTRGDAGTSTEVDAGLERDAGPPDAGPSDAGSGPSDAGTPRCSVTTDVVRCSVRVTPMVVSGVTREVYWEAPTTPPPASGYPVVVMYQGSFGSPSLTWTQVASTTPFGGYQQARLQALLLERGFVVVAPVALGGVAWQTNTGLVWSLTNDSAFVTALLDGFSRGDFGPIDTARQYATGISSGGYMTSRMAVSYPGEFRALAIASASYATCAGVVCVVPTLPMNHPPTLFLHGALDTTVPEYTARQYFTALGNDGVTTDFVSAPLVGHAWLDVAPERVTAWFETH
jgi:poly(3-hydroxybutyrate) depolymerase